MSEETVWDEAWDEEFKKCATRALFQPTGTLTQAYCRVLHGQAARGVGIHVRTGKVHGVLADGRWVRGLGERWCLRSSGRCEG